MRNEKFRYQKNKKNIYIYIIKVCICGESLKGECLSLDNQGERFLFIEDLHGNLNVPCFERERERERERARKLKLIQNFDTKSLVFSLTNE